MEYRFTVSRACHKGDKILSSRAWEKEGVMIHHLLGHHRPIYRGVSGVKPCSQATSQTAVALVASIGRPWNRYNCRR